MGINADLRTFLLEDSDLTALIGQRIYPQQRPEGPFQDSIIYTELGGERTRSLQGFSGQQNTQFQFDCESYDYDRAKEIAGLIVDLLDCYQGTMGDSYVQGIFIEPSTDTIVPPQAADEKAIHIITVSPKVWFE